MQSGANRYAAAKPCAPHQGPEMTPNAAQSILALLALLLPCAAGADSKPMANRQVDSIAERVVPCASCHGSQGRATSEGWFPRIAGKPAGYLQNQLINFRDGRRNYPRMVYLIEHLSD